MTKTTDILKENIAEPGYELKRDTVEEVWRSYHDRLLGFIRRRVNDRFAAEDILQEIFIKIQAKIGSLEDNRKLESWIYQIARNSIIDYYRAHRQMAELPESLLAPVPAQDSDGRREIARCLLPMILLLPAHYRDALILSDVKRVKQKEIAERLGLSLSGVKVRIKRGRVMLKKLMLQCCEYTFDSRGNVVDWGRTETGCTRGSACKEK